MNRRVAVTGVGLISSLGNSYVTALERLACGESGVRAVPEWQGFGLKSRVAGLIQGVEEKKAGASLSKKLLPSMSDAALYCCLAALDAVEDAGLEQAELSRASTACFVGSGCAGSISVFRAGELLYSGRGRRIDPFTVLRCMASSCSSAVANLLSIQGPSYSISAACATSTHSIGHAYHWIKSGAADLVIAGGGEDLNELVSSSFEGLRGAMSTRFNDTPELASRPFDLNRDGFVISGGAGIVVLEDLERARARGAHIRAELRGYAANSDCFDLVLPEPEGIQVSSCIEMAMTDARIGREEVDYVNCHATSTPAGDLAEVAALRRVFGDDMPYLSSTKSMTGHPIGASGALETIFCIGMLEKGFVAPSINIEKLAPEIEGLPVVTEAVKKPLSTVVKNSFGFGGTNAVLVLRSAAA